MSLLQLSKGVVKLLHAYTYMTILFHSLIQANYHQLTVMFHSLSEWTMRTASVDNRCLVSRAHKDEHMRGKEHVTPIRADTLN